MERGQYQAAYRFASRQQMRAITKECWENDDQPEPNQKLR